MTEQLGGVAKHGGGRAPDEVFVGCGMGPPGHRPEDPLPQPVFFCLYQDEAGEVGFLQLTPLSAQVLGYLTEKGQSTFEELIQWLVSTYPQMLTETLTQGCLQLLEQLTAKGIVRGT